MMSVFWCVDVWTAYILITAYHSDIRIRRFNNSTDCPIKISFARQAKYNIDETAKMQMIKTLR